jgi:hypothetical protein
MVVGIVEVEIIGADLVRDGLNGENVWFISPPGDPPKLSSSLEELGFFPEATQALSDNHADFSQESYFTQLGRSS